MLQKEIWKQMGHNKNWLVPFPFCIFFFTSLKSVCLCLQKKKITKEIAIQKRQAAQDKVNRLCNGDNTVIYYQHQPTKQPTNHSATTIAITIYINIINININTNKNLHCYSINTHPYTYRHAYTCPDKRGNHRNLHICTYVHTRIHACVLFSTLRTDMRHDVK